MQRITGGVAVDLDDMLIRVHPGAGLVARAGGSVLVLFPPIPDQTPLADELLSIVEDPGNAAAPGRSLARRVARLVADAEPGDVPSFGLVSLADEGLVLILHGNADADVSWPDGREHLSGHQVATWVDRILKLPMDLLVVGPSGEPCEASDPRVCLRRGVVHGGGFSVVPTGSTDAPEGMPDHGFPEAAVLPSAPAFAGEGAQGRTPPVSDGSPDDTRMVPPRSARTTSESPPDPVSSGAFLALLPEKASREELGEAWPGADPSPVQPAADLPEGPRVRGAVCAGGHLSRPSSASCGVCGLVLDPKADLVEGPRPALGRIVFDDGGSFGLDGDYVLGREPASDPDVVSGRARAFVVDDPGRSVSRVHAALAIDGWDVVLTDRGAANGTYIALPGQDGWAPILPNQPTIVERGTRVRLGDRECRFESGSATQ